MNSNNQFKTKFKTFHNKTFETQTVSRFIHASDIHLGSHQYRNEYRADDFVRVFHEILELAIIHSADFIILAGDVFTSLEMLPGILLKIITILKDFKEFTNNSIMIIAIEGNHDIRKFSRSVRFERRGQSWLKLLNTLELIILLDAEIDESSEKIFKSYNFDMNKGGKIQINNVMIYGSRYLGEQPVSYLSKIRKAIVKKKEIFNILILHFGIEGQMENVPGIKLEDIQPLHYRVDYLALGHFHKQFILEDWIYNPGSSEAVCIMDNSYKRGIFLVEISKKLEKFEKKVKIIQLVNRKSLWETIYINFEMRNKQEIETFILDKLKSSLKYLNYNFHPSNHQMPVLYLILKGHEPSKSCRVNEKDLRKKICDTLPIVDVKVYQKYVKSLRTLDNYILA
ncbi:MAG: exonuclease SbcCD subunit D [Candidatus Heimdallarchaeota archaeon]